MVEETTHFYEVDGALFPADEVHRAINAIFEGIAKEFMRTSRNPKAFVLRLVSMKKNPKNRAKVWRMAIAHLNKNNLTVKREEITGKYHITKIDFARVGVDNIG